MAICSTSYGGPKMYDTYPLWVGMWVFHTWGTPPDSEFLEAEFLEDSAFLLVADNPWTRTLPPFHL